MCVCVFLNQFSFAINRFQTTTIISHHLSSDEETRRKERAAKPLSKRKAVCADGQKFLPERVSADHIHSFSKKLNRKPTCKYIAWIDVSRFSFLVFHIPSSLLYGWMVRKGIRSSPPCDCCWLCTSISLGGATVKANSGRGL